MHYCNFLINGNRANNYYLVKLAFYAIGILNKLLTYSKYACAGHYFGFLLDFDYPMDECTEQGSSLSMLPSEHILLTKNLTPDEYVYDMCNSMINLSG